MHIPVFFFNLVLIEIWSQVDPISCASSGMFVNLSAVMLRLCEPFLDANLTKREKIDPKYVLNSSRLDIRWETCSEHISFRSFLLYFFIISSCGSLMLTI